MLGFGKSRTEKQVLKLERITMAIETAYEKGAYDAARYGVHKRQQVLFWLATEGEWSDEQIYNYLAKRGLVRSVTDQEYASKIVDKLQAF